MTREGQTENHDVVVIGDSTDDGEGVRVLRSRPGRLDIGEVRPVKEGQNIAHSELVRLKPWEETPAVADVEVLYSPTKEADQEHCDATRQGPPRVSTESYRRTWEIIFGSGSSPDDGVVN